VERHLDRLAGSAADPIGLAAFSQLPPAAALDLFVIVLLLVAAHGAYGLARRFGADRPAAVLAGLAFAGSGYIACQLKHLGIVSTIVWLPVGLALIDRALDTRVDAPLPTTARRALFMAAFGLVFAEQVLSGFPQSAYICALVYGSFALFRALTNHEYFGRVRLSLVLLVGLGAAVVLAVAAGAVVLLPLSELAATSDRSGAMGWEWSTRWAYWPWNALTFLIPYVNGDVSNDSMTFQRVSGASGLAGSFSRATQWVSVQWRSRGCWPKTSCWRLRPVSHGSRNRSTCDPRCRTSNRKPGR